jgi:sulfotransferase family protein
MMGTMGMLSAVSNRIGFVAYRAVTCPLRMLPTFIVVGAHRGGTSAFYHYLTEHPSVAAATIKEVNFFDRNFHKGTLWYRAHFPSFTYKRLREMTNDGPLITGEASPYYLFHPHVAERVARTLPQIKLIALLRNPVDRGYSHYQRNVSLGWELSPFEDVIASEEQHIREITQSGAVVGDDPRDVVARSSCLARSLYADQLERWLRYFPREQFLILRSEDFYADPAAALKQALAFLGVPVHGLPVRAHYVRFAGYATPAESGGAQPIDPALGERLRAYFAPHNRHLYEIIGRDMGWE